MGIPIDTRIAIAKGIASSLTAIQSTTLAHEDVEVQACIGVLETLLFVATEGEWCNFYLKTGEWCNFYLKTGEWLAIQPNESVPGLDAPEPDEVASPGELSPRKIALAWLSETIDEIDGRTRWAESPTAAAVVDVLKIAKSAAEARRIQGLARHCAHWATLNGVGQHRM